MDPCGPNHVYAVTSDSQLLEYDQDTGAFIRLAGTIIDSQTGLVLQVKQIEFDGAGNLYGVDGLADRLVLIGTANAQATPLMESATVNPDDVTAVTFDISRDEMLGARSSDEKFVAFRGTRADDMAGITAKAVNSLNIGQDNSDGFDGRIVATGDSFTAVKVNGEFSGSLTTQGAITQYTQVNGDLSGAIDAAKDISKVTVNSGDFTHGASILTGRNLGSFTVAQGDFAGVILASSAGSITVNGTGVRHSAILIANNAKQISFTGGFDGTMQLGSVDSLTIAGSLSDTASISIEQDAGNIKLGGTTAQSQLIDDHNIGSVTVGTVHRGLIAARRNIGTITVHDATDGIVLAGANIKSITATGLVTDSLFSSGVWIGDDHIYNTDDDVIYGGSITTATFQNDFIDSAIVAGVLPNLINGPGIPDDKLAYTGDPDNFNIAYIDSAEGVSVLSSNLGTVNFLQDVISTNFVAGHAPVVAAAGTIGKIYQRQHGATITHRAYSDPFGPPTVTDARLVATTEVDITFSEEMDSGSFILSQDVDGDGKLSSLSDIVGTVTVTDAQGNVLNNIHLGYANTVINGVSCGVLKVVSPTPFSNGVMVTLSGSLTGAAVTDRSGTRSLLRDFNRDGVKSIGEDMAGTILDGGGDGIEGGDYTFIGSNADLSTGFADAVPFSDPADAGMVDIHGTFAPLALYSLIGSTPLFSGDCDVYKFTAQAYQFVSLDLSTQASAEMGLFYLDDQGTPDPSDDVYKLLASEQDNVVMDPATRKATTSPKDVFEAFELPSTGTYYVVVMASQSLNAVPVETPLVTSEPYRLQVVLASSDDMLDGSPNMYYATPDNQKIAYVSSTLDQHSNVLGSNSHKQLIYLNFGGGIATLFDNNSAITVRPMDPTQLDAGFAGLEDEIANGSSADGVTGVVDKIMSIYENMPASLGSVNVQRISSLAQWQSATSGLCFTTVDPKTWGLDANTDYITVFFGETDNNVLGIDDYGLTSDISTAGQQHAENCVVFLQNCLLTGSFDSAATTTSAKLNEATNFLANVGAHELGHALGFNHQPTSRTNYTLVWDDPDNNPATPNDSNMGVALMSYYPLSVMMTQLAQLGTANLEPSEFPMNSTPAPSIDTADMLKWWYS